MEKLKNNDFEVKFELIKFNCRLVPCWVFGIGICKVLFVNLSQFSYGEWVFYDSKGNPKYYFEANNNLCNDNYTISSFVEKNNLNYSDLLLEILHKKGYNDARKFPKGISVRFEGKSYLANIELIKIVDYFKI